MPGFMKEVLGETACIGRLPDHDRAGSRDAREAEQKGKDGFCGIHGTHEWSLHRADPTDVPS